MRHVNLRPAAGIPLRLSARRMRHALIVASLTSALCVLLAACGLAGNTSSPQSQFSPITQQSPIVSQGQIVEQDITQFCSALHAGAYDQAYALMSTRLKQTVTSASQLPNILGSQKKVTDCSDFGNGNFLKISATEATDQVMWTYTLTQLNSSTQGGGTMTFVQQGSAWQLDSVTG